MKTYQKLLEYLSNKTGIPLETIIPISLSELPQRNLYATINGIDGYGIRRRQIKGGIWVFEVWCSPVDKETYFGKTFSLDCSEFDRIYKIKRITNHNDFNIPVKLLDEEYKYCESGGWYSMKFVYELDGIKYHSN